MRGSARRSEAGLHGVLWSYLSVAILNVPFTETPAPPPMTMPSINAICGFWREPKKLFSSYSRRKNLQGVPRFDLGGPESILMPAIAESTYRFASSGLPALMCWTANLTSPPAQKACSDRISQPMPRGFGPAIDFSLTPTYSRPVDLGLQIGCPWLWHDFQLDSSICRNSALLDWIEQKENKKPTFPPLPLMRIAVMLSSLFQLSYWFRNSPTCVQSWSDIVNPLHDVIWFPVKRV